MQTLKPCQSNPFRRFAEPDQSLLVLMHSQVHILNTTNDYLTTYKHIARKGHRFSSHNLYNVSA